MSSGPSSAFLTSLHPSGQDDDGVVTLALTPDQCRDRNERERLIDRALSALDPDGIIWVEAPSPWRSALIALLRARGLATGAPSVRRARGKRATHIALSARTVHFAIDRGDISRRWLPILAMLRAPLGQALLTRVLPDVAFAAFRPGTRPFAWLLDRIDSEQGADIVLSTNWRGERAPYLVFAVGAGQVLVAKRGRSDFRAQIEHEALMLKTLAPDLEGCKLAIPRLIDIMTTPTLSTLIESHVSGRPMAHLIRQGYHRELDNIAARLAEWLTCWSDQTLHRVELTPHLADQCILSPARAVAGWIDGGSAYVDWLSRETGRLIGRKVPMVAAHNDLTMANVLGDAAGIRSIVDWEAASADGLPLTDFRYAVCDATALIAGADRLAAFRACFLKGGKYQRSLQQIEAPLRQIVGGPSEWLELCVQAGWLRHAANEQGRSSSSPIDGSFIAIANLLAASCREGGWE